MKSALPSVALVVALTVACAPATVPPGARNAAPLPTQGSGFGAERLRKMQGLTGFDALRMLPDYYGRANLSPAPPFVLIMDGARTGYLDMLKSIPATDLYEIRVLNESQTITSGGSVEIIVTTVAGRKKRY